MRRYLLLALVVFLVACVPQQPTVPEGTYDEFAQCLYDSGMRVYGSYTCHFCEQQREMFGSAFEYVQEIECHPDGEDSQYERCRAKNIEATPTWTFEPEGVEQQRLVGLQRLETLAEVSGCAL